MKCDELKDYDYDPDFPFQSRGRFYVADEVDAAIAELKDENRKLKRALWLARAAFCGRSVEWLSGIMSHCLVGQIDLYKKCEQRKNRYMKAFNKCRNKAKEYE